MSTCRSTFMRAVRSTLLVALLAWAVPTAAQQTGEECVLFCASITCGEAEHYATWDGDIPNAMYSAGSHSPCLDGTCADKHPSCDPGFEASLTPLLDELERAIDAEDGPSVGRALALLGARAVIHEERAAVQLRACDGGVVGHFALPEGTLADLGNENARLDIARNAVNEFVSGMPENTGLGAEATVDLLIAVRGGPDLRPES